MKDQILAILREIKKDKSLDENTHLVFGGILGSLDILQLISRLEEEYSIKISVEEVIPNNFDTVEGITKMIRRLKG